MATQTAGRAAVTADRPLRRLIPRRRLRARTRLHRRRPPAHPPTRAVLILRRTSHPVARPTHRHLLGSPIILLMVSPVTASHRPTVNPVTDNLSLHTASQTTDLPSLRTAPHLPSRHPMVNLHMGSSSPRMALRIHRHSNTVRRANPATVLLSTNSRHMVSPMDHHTVNPMVNRSMAPPALMLPSRHTVVSPPVATSRGGTPGIPASRRTAAASSSITRVGMAGVTENIDFVKWPKRAFVVVQGEGGTNGWKSAR